MCSTLVAAGAYVHLDSKLYLQYASCMLNVLDELAEACLDSVLLQSLSGLSLVTHMLNSLMHSEDSRATEPKKFVKNSRCKKNRFCFVRDSFVCQDASVVFDHSFDLSRMTRTFPGVTIVNSALPDAPLVLQNLERVCASVSEEIWLEVNRPDGHLQVLKKLLPSGPVFTPLELGPLTVFGNFNYCPEYPANSAFYQRQYFMYDVSNAATVKNAFTASHILIRQGFTCMAAAMFLKQFWSEYFALVGEEFSDCGWETLSFLDSSTKSKIVPTAANVDPYFEPIELTKRLEFILPLLTEEERDERNVKTVLGHYISYPNCDKKWKAFGTRAWYLELFRNPFIRQVHLQNFHEKLMVGCLFLLKFIPKATKTHFSRRQNGLVIVRKASWFREQESEMALYLYDYLRKYSKDSSYQSWEFNAKRAKPSSITKITRSPSPSAANSRQPQRRKANGRF